MTAAEAMNFSQQESLVRRFFERRNGELFKSIRRARSEIAERMSAEGLGQSGAFVGAVTKAYVAGFEAFAKGLIGDTLDLLQRSQIPIDREVVDWINGHVVPFLESAAKNVGREVANSPDLTDRLEPTLGDSLRNVKRDLALVLDLELVTKSEAKTVVDEALRDPLVPLQNRRGLEQAFAAWLKDSNEPLCLCFFDLDHFKDVNDKHGGHKTGDEALISVAEVASACVRGKGGAFRFGGDEFVLLLRNHTREEGLAVAERFRREVNASPRTSQQLTVSVSIGVAVYPDDGTDFPTLQKAADDALYDAKHRGRNLVRYKGEPEPKSAAPREPERKAPEPGGWSASEQQTILQEYFRHRAARCPRDQALLDVQDVTAFEDATPTLLVSCRLCGLSGQVR